MHNDTSSLSRLIELISSTDHQEAVLPTEFASHPSGRHMSWRDRLIPFRKKFVIGLDIRPDCLRLVKICRMSEHRRELTDYLSIPFEPGQPDNRQQFSHLLKSVLSRFCNSSNVWIWATTFMKQLETRYIRIPKVPKSQIAHIVYRIYQRESPFDEKIYIFDFDVLGEVVENDDIIKTEIMAYIAPRQEVERWQQIFSDIGFPLKGLSAYPFALQNLFRARYLKTGEHVCWLDVGMSRSRIDVFSARGDLVLSRNIKTSVSSMVEEIKNMVDEETYGGSSGYSAFKEGMRLSAGTTPARHILSNFISGAPSGSAFGERYEGRPEDVLEMISKPLQRLAWQVERTIEYSLSNLGSEMVKTLYISGEISACEPIIRHIGTFFNFPLEIRGIAPLFREILFSEDASGPQSVGERSDFIPTIGMAFSEGHFTPNFIFTHEDKKKHSNLVRLNYGVMITCLLLAVLAVGSYYWQKRLIHQKNAEIARLEEIFGRWRKTNGLYIDPSLIDLQLSQIRRERHNVTAYTRKYLSVAVLSGIVDATPENVQLTRLALRLGRADRRKAGKDRKEEEAGKSVILEGQIFGNRMKFEVSLMKYLAELRKRKIFAQPVIKRKAEKQINGKAVLYFSIYLDAVGV